MYFLKGDFINCITSETGSIRHLAPALNLMSSGKEKETLYSNELLDVYRIKNGQDFPFLTKNLKHPLNKRHILLLEQEYERVHSLGSAYLLKPVTTHFIESPTQVLYEDPDGVLLSELLNAEVSIDHALEIMILLLESVEHFHDHHFVIHQVTPFNIIMNKKKKLVKYINAMCFHFLESGPVVHDEAIFYTAREKPYLVPETKENKIQPHFQSDLYSLGIILYELLTGKLPIDNRNMMPPVAVNGFVPRVLSDIVMKLICHDLNDRYKSCLGLKTDILRCYNQLSTNSKISYFFPGQQDVTPKFELSHFITGRDREAKEIQEFLRNSENRNCNVLVISGESGVGKTSLVTFLIKEGLNAGELFLATKSLENDAAVPYSSLKKALNNYLMALSLPEKAAFETQLLNAVGSDNFDILAGLLSELKIKKDENTLGLKEFPDPVEHQNRFHLSLLTFLKILSEKSSVYLFLDDIHWTDQATIQLLSKMIRENIRITIILAYREEESYLFKDNIYFEFIKRNSHFLKLSPLLPSDIRLFLKQEKLCSDENSDFLSRVIFTKTHGNPFYMKEFLKQLYDEGVLRFDKTQLTWTWSSEKIALYDVSENVANLLCRRLDKLPSSRLSVLQVSSILGFSFDLTTLSIISGRSTLEIAALLHQAIEDGLILRLSKESDLSLELTESDQKGFNILYRFSHDTILNAVYSSIHEDEKIALHLKAGSVLLQDYEKTTSSFSVFAVVHHFNVAHEYIYDEALRHKLAVLNYLAGKKAMDETLYPAAKTYFLTSLTYYNPAYDSEKTLYFDLQFEQAQNYFLLADYSASERLFSDLIDSANKTQRIRIWEKKTILYTILHDYEKSIECGLLALRELNFYLSARVNPVQILFQYVKLRAKIGPDIAKTLLALPETDNPQVIEIIDVISQLSIPTYECNQNLMILGALKAFDLSLTHGNTINSPFSYFCYGFLLTAVFGNYSLGITLGKVCLELLQKSNNTPLEGKLLFSYAIMMGHWDAPLTGSIQKLKKAYELCIKTGNLSFASVCLWNISTLSFYDGEKLDILSHDLSDRIRFLTNQAIHDTALILQILMACVHTLSGTLSLAELEKTVAHIYEGIGDIGHNKNLLANHYIHKMEIYFFFGDYKKAQLWGKKAKKILQYTRGQFIETVYYYFYFLVTLKTSRSMIKKALVFFQLRKILRKYKKWSTVAPHNHGAPYHLLKAEWYDFLGLGGYLSEKEYLKALQESGKFRCRYKEALIRELFGAYYLRQNRFAHSKEQFRAAILLYGNWGAFGKEKELKTEYIRLFKEAPFVEK